jgi:hypothetical protein
MCERHGLRQISGPKKATKPATGNDVDRLGADRSRKQAQQCEEQNNAEMREELDRHRL